MTGSVHRSRPPQGTAHPAAHQTRFSNRGAGRFFFVLKAFGIGATWTDFPTRRTLTHMPKTPTRVGRPTSPEHNPHEFRIRSSAQGSAR